jgi:hypothetical protein
MLMNNILDETQHLVLLMDWVSPRQKSAVYKLTKTKI